MCCIQVAKAKGSTTKKNNSLLSLDDSNDVAINEGFQVRSKNSLAVNLIPAIPLSFALVQEPSYQLHITPPIHAICSFNDLEHVIVQVDTEQPTGQQVVDNSGSGDQVCSTSAS